MASVVLSQPNSADCLAASQILLGSGGVASSGPVVVGAGGVQVRPQTGEALIEIVSRDGAALLHWESPEGAVAMDMNLSASGVLNMAPYGGASNNLITIGDPRASVGPPALLANSEIFGFTSSFQAGIATIPIAAADIAVVNTNITATSIVMLQIQGAAADATLTSVIADLQPSSGFIITGNAAATAAVVVSYFVVRY